MNDARAYAARGQLRAWKNTFDPEGAGVSPFAALLHGEDYAALAPRLGIPVALAELYESIFMGGFSILEESPSGARYSVQPDAPGLFIDLLTAIPPGADLRPVPGAFIAAALDRLATAPPSVFGSLPDGVAALLQRAAGVHRAAAAGADAVSDWPALRKDAIVLTNAIADERQRPLASFAESVAWDPAEAPEELASAVGMLIFQLGVSTLQGVDCALVSDEEAALHARVTALIAEVRATGREPEQEEIHALPEVQRLIAFNDPEREARTRARCESEKADFARCLHGLLIEAVAHAGRAA